MIALPWSRDKQIDSNELLEEEMVRQLVIMKKNDVNSEDYQKAMDKYEKLHDNLIKELRLKESRRARWFDGGLTGILAIVTLTAEQWTPLTSKWYSSIIKKFRSGRF